MDFGIEYFALSLPIVITLIVFIFVYKQAQSKHNALVEIAKNIKDPSELKKVLALLDEKQKPINKKASGVITFFVGVGMFGLGYYFLGTILKGVGVLIAAIGAGIFIGAYFFPDKKES